MSQFTSYISIEITCQMKFVEIHKDQLILRWIQLLHIHYESLCEVVKLSWSIHSILLQMSFFDSTPPKEIFSVFNNIFSLAQLDGVKKRMNGQHHPMRIVRILFKVDSDWNEFKYSVGTQWTRNVYWLFEYETVIQDKLSICMSTNWLECSARI